MLEYEVKIDISARHVHLSEEDATILFGKGYELTEKKKIAVGALAKERVTLVGPKKKIENVGILLPFRKQTQVELSMTDTYALGIQAPIRLSGDISGSAPIKIVGPAGELQLQEGVIVAKRHVHIGPNLAKRYGLTTESSVRVAVKTPQRSIVFDDVNVRISKPGKNEEIPNVHLDTDEGNAAGIHGSEMGTLLIYYRSN